MLAFALSFGIIISLTQLFITAKKSNQLQMSLISLQANGTLAVQLLKEAIHQAGNIGCRQLTNDFPIYFATHDALTPQNVLRGDSHTLIVVHARYPSVTFSQTARNKNIIYLNQPTHFKINELVLIADCQHAEIREIAAITHQGELQQITFKKPLDYAYTKAGELSLLELNRFYIDKTNREDSSGHPIYSLYVTNQFGMKIELIEGITQMDVSYRLRDANVIGVAIAFTLAAYPLEKKWYGYIAARSLG